MTTVLSKKAFAASINISPSRLSHLLAESKIGGRAIVGRGRAARINVAIAKAQLAKTLDLDRRTGAGGRARLDRASSDRIGLALKRARLAQLEMGVERMRAEAKALDGKWVDAKAARRGMATIPGRMLKMYDAMLPGMAAGVAARLGVPQADVLDIIRAELKARLAEAKLP